MTMTTGMLGMQLIRNFEGFVDHVYKDAVGYPTIGIGHLIRAGEIFPEKITEVEAYDILAKDLKEAEDAVNKMVKVPLRQNQFDALVSFAFNLGAGNLASSTLLKMVNASDFNNAAGQFVRWNRAGGKVLAGLTRRREAEAALFLQA